MKAAFLLSMVLYSISFGGEYSRCEAGSLPQEEVYALKIIGAKLEMPWNFSVDPCGGEKGWVEVHDFALARHLANNLTCDCSPDTNICHVVSIRLTEMNLAGVLPEEFADLTHLTFLDLSRNYIRGKIPPEWGSLPLTNLVIEANLMDGPIPATLGKLTKLTRLLIASNNFSGELPESLGNLKNMSTFIMDGNPISGKIPSFIGNWTQLQRLYMQGTSLEGPFPPTFANLSSLTSLRVSDMRGFTDFPPLQNMKNMHQLVLRNLSISDRIPDYVGEMADLYSLDLTFNNLSGDIPTGFGILPNAAYMYFSNNKLNGTIPTWIFSKNNKYVDISYNDFTEDPSVSDCSDAPPILTSIYSETNKNS